MNDSSSKTFFITGISSGFGQALASAALADGHRVVGTARSPEAASTFEALRPGRAFARQLDVTDHPAVLRVVQDVERSIGPVDVLVNNAGYGHEGVLEESPLEDMRRQFEVNYWGPVYGSWTAIDYLKSGGALINVASALADRAIPLQGNYCATKHALKGFTDALRMELEESGIPISVTLIKPSSMNTPLFEKARSYMGVEPQPVPPV